MLQHVSLLPFNRNNEVIFLRFYSFILRCVLFSIVFRKKMRKKEIKTNKVYSLSVSKFTDRIFLKTEPKVVSLRQIILLISILLSLSWSLSNSVCSFIGFLYLTFGKCSCLVLPFILLIL